MRGQASCRDGGPAGRCVTQIAADGIVTIMRSPPRAPLYNPDYYYEFVTLPGTVMAYVVTAFFTMGFGYALTAKALGRPVRGMGRLFHLPRRHRHGSRGDRLRTGIGALHFLSAPPGEWLVLRWSIPSDSASM